MIYDIEAPGSVPAGCEDDIEGGSASQGVQACLCVMASWASRVACVEVGQRHAGALIARWHGDRLAPEIEQQRAQDMCQRHGRVVLKRKWAAAGAGSRGKPPTSSRPWQNKPAGDM